MKKKKLFFASSAELKDDRQQFETFINRKNKEWYDKGIFLELIIWEDFLDAVSQTRLQDEYDKSIRESDIFIMLFFTKVGKYTEEEFEAAFGQFKSTNKPFIFTYFKDAEVSLGSININKDMLSLLNFKEKLDKLGHFYTSYKNIEEFQLKFSQQLEKLVATGFIEFNQPSDLKEKNIVKKDIERVKEIHIGDEGNLSNETYNRKNVIEGNVRDAESLRLGDG